MVPVRLDVVVKVKEREEERRLEALGKTMRAAQLAHHELQAAEALTRRERGPARSAADFSNDDLARVRLLEQVEAAKKRLHEATAAADKSRTEWTKAHHSAEAVRRVADTRRAEVVESNERAERKAFDELALLQFARVG